LGDEKMNIRKLFRGAVVSLAVAGLCLPPVVSAEPAPAPAVSDIALADGGVLHGQVIDLQGGNNVGVPVSVRSQNQEIARAVTAKDGRFSVQGLHGGVYQVAAGQGQGIYRLWAANTAPPASQNSAIVYTQNCPGGGGGAGGGGGLKMLLANPIVITGLVATAIAVPVALSNSGSSSP
jgi:hypothetical protein